MYKGLAEALQGCSKLQRLRSGRRNQRIELQIFESTYSGTLLFEWGACPVIESGTEVFKANILCFRKNTRVKRSRTIRDAKYTPLDRLRLKYRRQVHDVNLVEEIEICGGFIANLNTVSKFTFRYQLTSQTPHSQAKRRRASQYTDATQRRTVLSSAPG